MSTWFIRVLVFIISSLIIVHAYPSSMTKHKWLQERLTQQPHVAYEMSSDDIGHDLYENGELTPWLYRSRKFCCAPPL